MERIHPFDVTDEYLDGIIEGDIAQVSMDGECVYFQEDAIELGYHCCLDFELFAPFNLTPTVDWTGKRLQIRWDEDGNAFTHVQLLPGSGIRIELRI